MIHHLVLSMVCVVLLFIAGRQRNDDVKRALFFICFGLIFLFLAFRFDFGNDYIGYYDDFYEINSVGGFDYFGNTAHSEVGWVWLCMLFKPIGFIGMVACLSLFSVSVYGAFIYKYCPANYYWLAVFIYLFVPSNMLIQSSAMRQSLSISVFLLALGFLLNGQLIRYVLISYLATLFHTSAFVVFGLVLLPFLPRIKKYTVLMIAVVYLMSFAFAVSLSPIINSIVVQYFQRYEVYQSAAELQSGLGIIALSLIFAFILYGSVGLNARDQMLVKVAAIGYLIIPFGFLIVMISRLSMYFHVVLIVVIPIVIAGYKDGVVKNLFVVFFILISLYAYIEFFNSPIWFDKFREYKTILSS